MIWIAVLGLASMVAVVGGTAGTLAQFARAHDPRPQVPLRARYRRGRHQAARTPWLARLADAYLAGAREYAAASALLRGEAI